MYLIASTNINILLSSSGQGTKHKHFLGRYAALWLGPACRQDGVGPTSHLDDEYTWEKKKKKAYQTSNILPLFIHE